jgi:hypothetical protein
MYLSLLVSSAMVINVRYLEVLADRMPYLHQYLTIINERKGGLMYLKSVDLAFSLMPVIEETTLQGSREPIL